MTNLPEFLSYGENARLFPVVADTSREQRTLSIFLAVLTQVPALARASLGSPGVRIGKRARISTFTEVTFKNDANNDDRPDGLIVVQTGRSTWGAFVKSSSKLTQDSRSKLTHLFPAACCRRTSAGGRVMWREEDDGSFQNKSKKMERDTIDGVDWKRQPGPYAEVMVAFTGSVAHEATKAVG